MSNNDENVSNTETTNSTTIDTTNMDTSKKKNKKLLPVIVVFLAVLIILGGGFYYYFNQPSKIVTNVINSAYNKFDDMIKKSNDFDYEKDTMILNGDLIIDTNLEGLEDLKDEKMNYTFGLDYANKKIELGGALTENKTKLIDIILYVIDNKAYVSLNDDYDKIINIDSEEFDFNDIFEIKSNSTSKDDINFIAKEFKNILIDSIETNKLKKSSESIKINSKNQKVNKISYNLNEKNTEKFMNNFINNTLKNKELLKKLSEVLDIDVKDIENELKDAKDEDWDSIGILNIYTKGVTNDLVKLEIIDSNAQVGLIVNKNNTEIYAKDDSTNILFNIKEYNNDKVDIDYSISENNAKISGNITITQKEIENNKFEGTISLDIKYDKYKLNIKSNYNAEYGAKIANIDTKDAISYNELNEADIENITMNILKRFEDSNIYNMIEDLISY